MSLLVKSGVPSDSTLWGTLPVLVQVHVTVPPAATVSTAWFVDPLCPLLKKMLPTMTATVGGAGAGAGAGAGPGAGAGWGSGPGSGGSVGVLLPLEHPASTARASGGQETPDHEFLPWCERDRAKMERAAVSPDFRAAQYAGSCVHLWLVERVGARSWDRIAGVNIGARRATNYPACGLTSIRQSLVAHQPEEGERT